MNPLTNRKGQQRERARVRCPAATLTQPTTAYLAGADGSSLADVRMVLITCSYKTQHTDKFIFFLNSTAHWPLTVTAFTSSKQVNWSTKW